MSSSEQRARFAAFVWDTAETFEPPTRFGVKQRRFVPNPWLAWAWDHIRKAGNR